MGPIAQPDGLRRFWGYSLLSAEDVIYHPRASGWPGQYPPEMAMMATIIVSSDIAGQNVKGAKRMRLIDAVEGFWLARRRDMSHRTYQDYELTFRRFAEFVGEGREFEEITSGDVHAFLNRWRRALSAKTVCNMWIALSALWTWAEREPSLRTPHIIRGGCSQATASKATGRALHPGGDPASVGGL